ncbi:hypothetical protein B0H17DRAFT_1129183 [Mycena rosella]|uniref:Uncharacterized protein n=1 Tax=Mycena rosella TaxID=1033263 RepID=A0AAD7GNP2_MYCRO|nr:hypothetical protein B0H17DRAFT_1129183 [Mycena rosella]
MFPLLLQLVLLLFVTALSVYLWTTHLVIATIVLVLPVIGSISYVILLGLAIKYEDSPFQTPLVPLLIQAFTTIMHLPGLAVINIRGLIIHLWAWCSQFFSSGTVLPQFTRYQPAENNPGRGLMDQYVSGLNVVSPHAAAQVPPVSWVLETSTALGMIDPAVEMGVDIQWPLDINLTSLTNIMMHLRQHFAQSFTVTYGCQDDGAAGLQLQAVLPGQSRHAIRSGKLYCSLRLITCSRGPRLSLA